MTDRTDGKEADASRGDRLDDATVFRNDATQLRADPSLTGGDAASGRGESSGGRSGEADTPKILKQRFVLEDRVGSGGMGSVFRARDLRKVEARDNNPHIAVKVLNNDFRQHPEAFIALEREASKSQTLRHSNIVSIFDFDKDGDIPFITMELLEGHELAELLQTYPTGLPDELAWTVIEGMVQGLAHAHAEGVVHADFKPGNVYVTDRQTTKILDFGIARAMRLNGGGEDTDFDPARLAALTPAYASREMLNGDNPEPRDDLFSLGVVIYLTLTGHHPYGRVPAHEAVKEGLKPARIKGLSRKRWRMLERCLAFNRQDRPRDADEVYEGLFARTPWLSVGAAAAAVALTIVTVIGAVQEDNEIRVVKEEVRQETLVDVQNGRIAQLLSEAQFDAAWERALFGEVQTLRALSPEPDAVRAVESKIAAAYAAQIAASGSLADAFALLQSGAKFGFLKEAQDELEGRIASAILALDADALDAGWLETAEQLVSYGARYFPESTIIASAKAEMVSYLHKEIVRLVEEQDVMVAEQAWNTFSNQVFDVGDWAHVDGALKATIADIEERRRVRQARQQRSALVAKLDAVLGVSCLRLDLALVEDFAHQASRTHPKHRALVTKHVGQRVTECVQQLGVVDPDRAQSMRRSAIERFGDFEQLTGEVDPCSLHYLVGNGNSDGEGGSCRDEVSERDAGPQMVVVPGRESLPNFAISKYEISWGEFAQFCAGREGCPDNLLPDVDPTLPVTGVPVEVMERFAAWLSEKTGYRYRLPTTSELDQVVGEVELDGRCGEARFDNEGLSAAAQGDANGLGVVNALSNVLEVAKGDEGYVLLSGHAKGACLTPTRQDVVQNGAARVGFRLVRELS